MREELKKGGEKKAQRVAKLKGRGADRDERMERKPAKGSPLPLPRDGDKNKHFHKTKTLWYRRPVFVYTVAAFNPFLIRLPPLFRTPAIGPISGASTFGLLAF